MTHQARNTEMSSKIEALIEAENWRAARQAIRVELRLSPKNHWLLTRLGLTFYEERRYQRALEYELLALAEAPDAHWSCGTMPDRYRCLARIKQR
jgi:tetratricopeptide (TPR) repeat protein